MTDFCGRAVLRVLQHECSLCGLLLQGFPPLPLARAAARFAPAAGHLAGRRDAASGTAKLLLLHLVPLLLHEQLLQPMLLLACLGLLLLLLRLR